MFYTFAAEKYNTVKVINILEFVGERMEGGNK